MNKDLFCEHSFCDLNRTFVDWVLSYPFFCVECHFVFYLTLPAPSLHYFTTTTRHVLFASLRRGSAGRSSSRANVLPTTNHCFGRTHDVQKNHRHYQSAAAEAKSHDHKEVPDFAMFHRVSKTGVSKRLLPLKNDWVIVVTNLPSLLLPRLME